MQFAMIEPTNLELLLPTMNHSEVTATTDHFSETATQWFPDSVLIWLKNENIYEKNKPCVGFLITMVILGITGNSTVVYIYSTKVKKNTANFFILTLAVFDIVAGLTLIFEVFDRRFPMYSGEIVFLCKAIRLIETLANFNSLLLLVCIGFDRYRKICRPLTAFTKQKAKKFLLVILFITPFVSWPMALFHGPRKIEAGFPGVYGTDCADDDKFYNTFSMTFYYGFLTLLYIIFFIILITLYVKVYIAIWKWKKTIIGVDVEKIRSKSLRSISEHVSDMEKGYDNDVFSDNESSSSDKELYAKKSLKNGGIHINQMDNEDYKCHVMSKCTTNDQNTNNSRIFVTRSTSEQQTADEKNISEFHTKNNKGYVTVINVNGTSCYQTNEIHKESAKDHINVLKLNGASCEDSLSDSAKIFLDSSIVSKKTENEGQVKTSKNLLSNSQSSTVQFRSIKMTSLKPKQNLRQSSKSELGLQSPKSSAKLLQSTFIFAVITGALIVSYVPYFLIEILNATGTLTSDDMVIMSGWQQQVITLFNSSFCLNNAINPIIYSILSPSFQRELKALFTGKRSSKHWKNRTISQRNRYHS